MNNLKLVVFVIFSLASANGQLLCYTCDDCESDSVASVEPCGFAASVSTTHWPGQPGQWNPWDPALTPPYHPSTIYPPGSGITSQNYCYMTQWNSPCYQYLPCDPNYPVVPCYPHYPMPQCDSFNPTYPCFVSTGSVGEGGGGSWDLATPPVTSLPWWPAAKQAKVTSPTEVPSTQQYGCLSSRSIVNNRDVVRRGCARLESSKDETCNKATGGKHQKCAVCTTQLCNSETF
ncbi:uncharacterized protein LOC120423311 isoform X1 [Culex pipiens pallens]|uniref:uncharacterized protein LOC120423311 isoform X1 n=1 Tax=Culex pipiens pallens TaxID=42434 RepID=UPI00195474B8|nr:uncharacterized protein LOC120423311 isoform X1 [Culex pipiens pallens]